MNHIIDPGFIIVKLDFGLNKIGIIRQISFNHFYLFMFILFQELDLTDTKCLRWAQAASPSNSLQITDFPQDHISGFEFYQRIQLRVLIVSFGNKPDFITPEHLIIHCRKIVGHED